MKLHLSALIFLICTSFINCRDNSISDNFRPGKREYNWTFDSLTMPTSSQLVATDIWGSSQLDVWVTAWIDINIGSLWHYDGTRWISPSSPADIYDGRGLVNLNAVHGISSTSVWFVGSRTVSLGAGQTETHGFVMEWNGNDYIEYTDTLITNGEELKAVWGSSSNDILAVGLNGWALHFDGTIWEKLRLNNKIILNSVWGSSDNSVYCLGYQDDFIQPLDTTTYFFFKRNGDELAIVQSFLRTSVPADRWGVNSIWSQNNVTYSSGDGVYQLTNNNWIKVTDAATTLRRVRGNNMNNIFAVGNFNTILHFNGIDWKRIEAFQDSSFFWNGVFSMDSVVFIAGSDGTRTIVLKGN